MQASPILGVCNTGLVSNFIFDVDAVATSEKDTTAQEKSTTKKSSKRSGKKDATENSKTGDAKPSQREVKSHPTEESLVTDRIQRFSFHLRTKQISFRRLH